MNEIYYGPRCQIGYRICPKNCIEFYSPALEKVQVKLAPYESIQIRHRSFSVNPNVKTDCHTPSSLGGENCGGELGPVQ
jgi:hypothetical protein